MNGQFISLAKRVTQYKEVLNNTIHYREEWQQSLKRTVTQLMEKMIAETGLEATIDEKVEIENLEAIVLSLGDAKSGLYQIISDGFQRDLIKNNGSLIYQQLFNGKIIVLVNYPYIEGYGQPQPPKTIAIYRPEELTEPFILRHLETFITEITRWEDYDDDEPNKRIGFNLNFQAPINKEEA